MKNMFSLKSTIQDLIWIKSYKKYTVVKWYIKISYIIKIK